MPDPGRQQLSSARADRGARLTRQGVELPGWPGLTEVLRAELDDRDAQQRERGDQLRSASRASAPRRVMDRRLGLTQNEPKG
jgi:hypothetical protein